MLNSSDPDQARRYVEPDLDPICFQRFSTDDTVVGKETTFL